MQKRNDKIADNLRKVAVSGYAPTWRDLCEAVLCRASDGLKKDCIECVKELVELIRSNEPMRDGSGTIPVFGDFRYHANTGKKCFVIGEGRDLYGFDVVFAGDNTITTVPPEELQLEKPLWVSANEELCVCEKCGASIETVGKSGYPIMWRNGFYTGRLIHCPNCGDKLPNKSKGQDA